MVGSFIVEPCQVCLVMRMIKFSLREISSTSFTPYLTEYRKHESDMENASYDRAEMWTQVSFIKLK